MPFELLQRAARLKATAICVWSSDAGGPFLMSGAFCFDGGSGAIRWNRNMENKIGDAIQQKVK